MVGGNSGELSFPSPGDIRGYEINQAQSFDRTARGLRAAVSGVAACVGTGRRRCAGGARQGHPLAGVWGSLFGGECIIYDPEGDACWGWAAGVGDLARGMCAEWVYVCACVRLGRRVGA